MNTSDGYLHLNRDGRWPDFAWHNLVLGEDGTLRLDSLPLLEPPLTLDAASDGPAGIALGEDGTLYWSDGHRLLRRNPCDGSEGPLPCIGGEDDDVTAPRQTRALLFHPARPALLVADAANHRLELFAPDGFQLVDVWGGPGTEPGRFQEPWSLAADAEGNLYVVDRGNHRVQKFDLRGDVVPEFWETAQSAAGFEQPVEVAAGGAGEEIRVYVLDIGENPGEAKIFVLDAAGKLRATLVLLDVATPMGLLVHGDAIYLGDGQRLLKLRLDGTVVGEAAGYEGPVAGLAVGPEGELWVHPGSGVPLRFETDGAYVRSGLLWGGPFGGDRPWAWHRLRALGDPLQDGSHLRFYLYASDDFDESDDGSKPPDPKTTGVSEPFDLGVWQEMPPDVPDVLIGAETSPQGGVDKTRYLWIGAHLAGEGRESPRLAQMRLDFDHETYAEHLPAVYRDPRMGADGALLDRFLSLFESFFVDVEEEIGDLARRFDPAATDAGWLPWLAGWLAFDLDADAPDEDQRRAIAEAFEAYAWRGTARGLRAALRLRTGVDAHVEEPHARTGWWALAPAGEEAGSPAALVSVLGASTVLVPSAAQGAVLGTTAVLGASDLIRDEDFGAPIFEETAHRLSVEVHRSQVAAPGKLDEVRAVVESEIPAHTAFQICLIEPRFRVGWQARLGVDTVVAASSAPPAPPGEDTGGFVLAGEDPTRLGDDARVGQTIRLGPAEPTNEYPNGQGPFG